MCCLFGLFDYGGFLSDLQKNRTLSALAKECADAVNEVRKAWRAQWDAVNKPFGFEVLDIRLGGVTERLLRAAERLEALVSGETDVLEELEQERLLLDHRENPGFRTIPLWDNEWAKIATANTI